MKKILSRNEPEFLKEVIRVQNEENQYLQKRIKQLQEEQEQLALPIKEKLCKLVNAFFSRGPEKNSSEQLQDREREKAEQECLFHSRTLFPSPKKKEEKKLNEEVVVHEMSDKELRDTAVEYTGDSNATAEDFKELAGFYDESVEITVIERRFTKSIHRRKKYKLDSALLTEDSGKDAVIITAPGPDKLAPGCTYSMNFALEVVSSKYLLHLPFDRQRREIFKPNGLSSITTKTLYNLSAMVAEHLRVTTGKIREDILGSGLCPHVDETPWPINNKDESDGYMWVLSNMAGGYYQFEPTRSGKVALEMFSTYQGPMMSDDFSGYKRFNKVDGVRRALCWAHARRKFYEIRQNYPDKCHEILTLVDKLFEFERQATTLEDLAEIRSEKSKAQVELIKDWLDENLQTHLPGSHFTKAIKYSLSNWMMLTEFLNDASIPLSNNDAERSIRHAVVGRKNSYGSRSINGADTAAILYTVIETCKRHDLDPRGYMKYVIKQNNRKKTPLTPMQMVKKRLQQNNVA